MIDAFVKLLSEGLLGLSPWTVLVILLVCTIVTVLSVTIYLHRSQAHRGVDLHPVISHFMRVWLWMSTGMNTLEWVAIHRKHHARCETEEDPHSPQTHGIGRVFFHGVVLYQIEAENKQTMEDYGHGTPDDWVERNVYCYAWLGPTLLALIDIALFGALGITFWALQMIWIPFFAAGVINGLGHWVGYRNFTTDDTSHNLVPWGIILGGEELHNNHHAFPSSAKFSLRPWEFDLGWVVLRVLETFKLAKVRRVAPELIRDMDKQQMDAETLKAVFVHRFEVMSDYCRNVIAPMVQEEAGKASDSLKKLPGQAKHLLSSDERFFSKVKREKLADVLNHSTTLNTVYTYRKKFQQIWDRSTTDPEQLLQALKDWCREAEETGIRVLQEFAKSVRYYQLGAGTLRAEAV